MEQFETVIDGIKYVIKADNFWGLFWATGYINGHLCMTSVTSKVSTEDAILKLVKKLEEL